MMPPKILHISVVTPSFNQAQFIQQTIESVLSQNYPSLTYVVQDGGSLDMTSKIVDPYKEKLQFESKKDKGQTDAINKGIAKTSGDIIAYINSDDYYLPGSFEKVNSIFSSRPEVMWIVGDAVIVDSKGNEIQSLIRLYKRFWRSIYSAGVLHLLNPIPQPAVFIRKSALEAVGVFDENLRYTMDYDMWQRLQKRFGNPYFIDEALAAFRIHGDSKGGSQYIQQFSEEEKVVAKYTKNAFLLWLHRLHNQCILLAYGLIK